MPGAVPAKKRTKLIGHLQEEWAREEYEELFMELGKKSLGAPGPARG